MQTIFCVYETKERFPRFIRTATDPKIAFADIFAHALDDRDDDLSNWVAEQFRAGREVGRYDLQSEVDDADVQLFLDYWEGQFAELVRLGEDANLSDDTLAARKVLAAIEAREEGQN